MSMQPHSILSSRNSTASTTTEASEESTSSRASPARSEECSLNVNRFFIVYFSSHALHCPLFSLYLLGIASTTLSTSPYGGTSVTWKILAGTISSDCSFYSESKDASISVAVGFVTEREAFFKDSKSSIKCESIHA